jgi:RimJ/RimL family protein N-acetyltransferase
VATALVIPGYTDIAIIGASLRVRPFAMSDADALTDAAQDPAVTRYSRLPKALMCRDGARRHIEGLDDAPRDDAIDLAVSPLASDALLGHVILRALDSEHSCAGVGWWTAPAYRGQGVATSAVRLLSDWAFDQLGLHRLWADVEEDNFSSRRVASRAGYKVEGILRDHAFVAGAHRNIVAYGRLATDRRPGQ